MEVNPTIVFRSPKVVEIEDRSMPAPADGQLLIATSRTLISIGTELTILSGEYPEDSYWANYGKLPFDPGYDNIGTVVEVGPGVAADWIGKKVGTYGGHTRYTLSDPQTVRPIQREISDEHAAFFTIAEIVMNGVRRAKVTWGEAVVVYGLGLLGQLLGWLAGSVMIWSCLFMIGNYLYGRMGYAAVLGGIFALSGLAVIYVINRLWAK
jgi:D-arabinose 1-dehydrogenase-like Zn-dependent alcohol dehydrogenase